jgi:hypothetical protein
MQEMTAEYRGPHTVLVRKNLVNMGISQHIRCIQELANGEFILHAAGDDVSYSDRTAKIAEVIKAGAVKPSLVMSNAHVIDESGNVLGLYSNQSTISAEFHGDPTDFGSIGPAASYVIAKELVTSFLPPMPEIYGEDRVALMRAKLRNGFVYTPDALVKYRISENGVWSSTFLSELSSGEVLNRHVRRAKDYKHIMTQLIIDLDYSSREDKSNIRKKIETVIREKERTITVIEGGFIEGLVVIVAALKSAVAAKELAKIFGIRWFPFLRKIRRVLPRKPAVHPAIQVPFER